MTIDHKHELDQQDFLITAAELLKAYVASSSNSSKPVVELACPDKLAAAFAAAGVPLKLDDHQAAAETSNELIAALQTTLKHSVRTSHPLFFNQLYARVEPVGVAADWAVAATNTNVHTYEVAPVFSLVEAALLDKVARVIGFRQHDGLLVPGGSISNTYALHLARFRKDPAVKTRGAAGGPVLVGFTSSHAHYSYEKAAHLTGLGTDNMVAVEADAQGQMLPHALEAAVAAARKQAKVPFFVGLTAGTTVTGGFDPIAAIAPIARRHGMWLHVDGSWGASLLLSPRHRGLLAGIEQADSVGWNAHKMLGLPSQCAAFISRHPGVLQDTNATHAPYLFQPDKLHGEYDIGDKSIQCGRKADAFKWWLQWKAVGDAGFAARVEHNIELAEHVEACVAAAGGAFLMAVPRVAANVCFWYVPPSLRPLDPAAASPEQWAALGRVAPAIKARMQQAGDAMIGYQPLGQLPNFFRLVFANCVGVSRQQLQQLLQRMDQYGRDL